MNNNYLRACIYHCVQEEYSYFSRPITIEHVAIDQTACYTSPIKSGEMMLHDPQIDTLGASRAVTWRQSGQSGRHLAPVGPSLGASRAVTWRQSGRHLAPVGPSLGASRAVTWRQSGRHLAPVGPSLGASRAVTWHQSGRHNSAFIM